MYKKTTRIDQSTEWKKSLKELRDGRNINLPDFNADSWVNKCGESLFPPTDDYKKFQKTAIEHLNSVEKAVMTRGISMYLSLIHI